LRIAVAARGRAKAEFALSPNIRGCIFSIMRSLAGLAGVTLSLVLGCATDQPFDTTETAQARAQRERQDRAVHDRLERLGKWDRSPGATAERWTED
jgi:hypothetical protein